jgi:hypothetical protein
LPGSRQGTRLTRCLRCLRQHYRTEFARIEARCKSRKATNGVATRFSAPANLSFAAMVAVNFGLVSWAQRLSMKIRMLRASMAIRTLFALCLFAATFNHARAILQHGVLWDYGYGSKIALTSQIYWALLTILDPLAAVLLFVKPRTGIWLTVAIIVSDVIHNTYYVATNDQWLAPFYLAQVAFLVIVLGLAPVAARAAASRPQAPV